MKRSFLLARVSVFSGQCSAWNCAVFPAYLTRCRPLANPLTAGSLHQASRSLRCRRSAFTLIELLVVIAIIAILAGLTLSTLGYVNRKGAESRAKAEVAALSSAIEGYKFDFGVYPSTQAVLYRELVGSGTQNSNKVFFEPTPSMVTNMVTGPFLDPWGSEYQYLTGAPATNNVGFFDLWSTAGNAAATNAPNWIRN